MADVACVVRQCLGVNVGMVIKNLQQWTLECYDLNLVDAYCNKKHRIICTVQIIRYCGDLQIAMRMLCAALVSYNLHCASYITLYLCTALVT
jgi:hypothetical protein